MLAPVIENPAIAAFALDVRRGLRKSQKELPAKYLYDDIGTALFEAITLLPEYGVTRADERLLRSHAAEIVAQLPAPVVVAELGSGTGRKTRWILEALAKKEYVLYYPIDISPAALHECKNQLGDLDSVHIAGLEHTYIDGLREVTARRTRGESLLVLFLGSTIGNFNRPEAGHFLRELSDLLSPGDTLLVGADLVKPLSKMLPAYDDPTGVTAAFNRNVLGRLNRELDANFNLRAFRHEVRYDERERRIEMHLRSEIAQTVSIGAADLEVPFREGETIWTESSHKFAAGELRTMAQNAGFRCVEQWVDAEWPFAESLFKRV